MKILILKLWYVACTIFCLYSLNTLVLESYEVAILAANQSEVDPIRILVCKKLNSFHINKTEVRVEEFKDEMVDHLNRSHCALYLVPYKRSIMRRLETGQYMIFDGLLCIPLEENEDKFRIKTILPQSTFLAFKKSTLDFAQQASWYEPFDQLVVQKKGPPYSNCCESNGRFRCLNECFKNNFRLSRYLYEGNETGLIHLKPATNQTIEREKICFEKCWRENCDIVRFIPFSGQRKPETTKLGAQTKLSEFDFYVQFIGLVCSLANISFNHLTSIGIKFAISKVQKSKVKMGFALLEMGHPLPQYGLLQLPLHHHGFALSSKRKKSNQKRNHEKSHQTENCSSGHLCGHQRLFQKVFNCNTYIGQFSRYKQTKQDDVGDWEDHRRCAEWLPGRHLHELSGKNV